MTSLSLKTPTSIKGRASLSGNLPSIQLPVANSLCDIPQYPHYTPPLSPIELPSQKLAAQGVSKKYIISENSMERFAKHILDLRDFCVSLTEINFCPIIQDVELVEQVDILSFLFKPFYSESLRYIAALHQSETDHTYVGSTALKQSAFPFVEQWKQYVQLVNKVRDKGIPSMAYYLNIKFQIIDGVIADIASHQKRESVHVEEVRKAAGTLRELIFQIKEGVNYLISKTNLVSMAPDVLESKIRDMRTLLRLYESAHNSEFVKSGYSICELFQLRANVQSSILDIIGGMKAAFSFNADIEKIYDQISEIHKMLKRITEQINLPQTVVRTVQKKTITDRRLRRRRQDDPLKDVKTFVNEGKGDLTEDNVVICGKLEIFIENISEELGNTESLDRNIDVWERLDNLRDMIMRKLKLAKETEREYILFQDKIRNQSGTITNLMKTSNRRTAEADDTEKRLNKMVKDLEDRNSEIMKQRNEALTITKRREEQLFKLRLKFNESKAWKSLKEISQILAKFLGVQIPDPNDIAQSALDLSIVLNKKGCLKCHNNEELHEDIRRRVSRVIKTKATESLVAIISNLIVDHQRLKYNFEIVDGNYSKVADDINMLKNCARNVEAKCNEIMQLDTDGDPERTIEDITQSAMKSLELLKIVHEKEMDSIAAQGVERRQNDLSLIMKEALALFPTVNISKSEDVKDMIVDVLRNANENYDKLKIEHRHKCDIIEKFMDWMKLKTNADGESMEKMMAMIDTKENPLEKVVYEQRLQKSELHNELHVLVTKIKGVLKVTDQTDYMEMVKLLHYTQGLVDKLHDTVEMERNVRELKAHEEENVQDDLSKCVIRLRALLNHSEKVDFSKESINSLMTLLNDLIDELSSEKQFIEINVINKLTKKMREETNIPHSLDPVEYLPMLSQKLEIYTNSVDVIKKMSLPLLDVFQNFDFTFASYDPTSSAFNNLKNRIMEMHGILNSDMKGEIMPDLSMFLTKNISLISGIISFISITFTFLQDEEEDIKDEKLEYEKKTSSMLAASRRTSILSLISVPSSRGKNSRMSSSRK